MTEKHTLQKEFAFNVTKNNQNNQKPEKKKKNLHKKTPVMSLH